MSDPNNHKSEIMSIVKSINEACVRGVGFDKLSGVFHEDAVMVHPGFLARAVGRDVCLKCYEDACSQMKFHKLDASEEQLEVFGSTAVMSHKYDCVWEGKGKTFTDDGHEIFVFVQDETGWKVAWRTLIPGSLQTEVCPTEQGPKSPKQNIRETCLDLIATLPVCHLTTMDGDGYPHTSAMNNLRYAKEYPSLVSLYEGQDNDFVLYMSTSMQSPKAARMQANPKVSVYFADADQFLGLMLGGEIEIITDQELKKRIWQDGWTIFYPNGPQGPEYGVIRLAPRVAKGWCRNQPFEIHV